jgi:hypothetical protein
MVGSIINQTLILVQALSLIIGFYLAGFGRDGGRILYSWGTL